MLEIVVGPTNAGPLLAVINIKQRNEKKNYHRYRHHYDQHKLLW